MTVRLLAVIACIVAIILFVIVAVATAANPHLVDWGFVALAAAVGLIALDGPVVR